MIRFLENETDFSGDPDNFNLFCWTGDYLGNDSKSIEICNSWNLQWMDFFKVYWKMGESSLEIAYFFENV